MTQTQTILHILKNCGSSGCHSFDLNKLANTTRSAARICELKDKGHNITSKMERKGGAWGKRYFLDYKKTTYIFDKERKVFKEQYEET